MIKKILLIISLLIFNVIIWEVIVFFMFNNKFQKTECPPNNVLPIETSDSKIEGSIKYITKLYSYYEQGILDNSIRTDVFKGYIKEIVFAKGVKNSFAYEVRLTLKYKNSEDYILYLDQNDIKTIEIYPSGLKGPVNTDLKSLKSGDFVEMRLTRSLFKPQDNNQKVVIIKII